MLLLRSWRPLLPTRLHPLRLQSRLLGSGPLGENRDGDDDDLVPTAADEEEARYLRDYVHLLPALVKAFHASAGHFIVPYALVLPGPEDAVMKKKVVSPEEIAQGNPRNNSGVVYGRVEDVREIDWPAPEQRFMFGMCLKYFMTHWKNEVKYAWVVQELRDMGFPVDGERKKIWWREQVLAALKVYYGIEGDSLVPQDFLVPRDDPRWPVAAWGLPLGMRVAFLRRFHEQGRLSPWQHDDLASVEFVFDVSEAEWNAAVFPALQTFKQVYGDCRVGISFVVPAESPWPRQSWGRRLGETVSNIRSNGTFAAQVARNAAELQEIGFVWDVNDHEWSERVLPSLQTFFQERGHCNVPQNFIVPSVYPWPEEARGMNLGTIVMSMRSHGYYKLQSTRDATLLKDIGFVWDSKQDKWDNVLLPAFQAFFQVYGHCRVPLDFVVPSEAPWPKRAKDVKLGVALQNIKYRGDYKAQRLQDREALEAIEFGEKKSKPPKK